MKLKQLFIPLTGLALISLASPGYAAGYDYKILPGAACQPRDRAFGGDLRTVESGDITNFNTSSRVVICPIVRDSIFSTSLNPAVIVRSVNNQTITCRFHIVNISGQVVQPSTRSTSSGLPTKLFFGPFVATSLGDEGSYVISCTLPPGGAQVINYISGEFFADDALRTDKNR